MQANYRQRLRIVFSKSGPARYISHLDLALTLERAMKRAHIPLAYTQGYNRRPRMQLAAALPLGFTSECELADIWLLKEMAPETAHARLNAKMAPGIAVQAVTEVPISGAALQTLTVESTYDVILSQSVDRKVLAENIVNLEGVDTLLLERRGKQYDLRPLILDLSLKENLNEPSLLQMRLCLEPGKNGRPDEVLRALEIDPLSAHIHRTAIVLADGSETT